MTISGQGLLLVVLATNLVLLPVSITNASAQETSSGISLLAQGTGEFTCTTQKTIQDVRLFILLSESTTQGFANSPSGLGLHSLDEGTIAIKLDGGNIDGGHFSITGILLDDEMCGEISPLSFSGNGECGIGTSITIRSASGSMGTFVSDVSCFE